MIHFSGSFDGGKMMMTGTTRAGAAVTTHRMTWTPIAEGGLRQVWETSTDRGATWALGFDGTYLEEVAAGVSTGPTPAYGWIMREGASGALVVHLVPWSSRWVGSFS